MFRSEEGDCQFDTCESCGLTVKGNIVLCVKCGECILSRCSGVKRATVNLHM